MQTLDVISVNLWDILFSLLNLALLYFVVRRFLYRPVKKMLDARQSTIEGDYEKAREAKEKALSDQKAYEEKLLCAEKEAEQVIAGAVTTAGRREEEILNKAREKAGGILRQAEADAALEKKKSEDAIKEEIVLVSSLLTEKMLEREVSLADHRKLIDSFLSDLGEDDASNASR